MISQDIHLTRAMNGQPTEPSYYTVIFERGIDPDVDNPEICHSHSEIPDEWPAAADILAFRARVCKRVTALYENERAWSDRKIGRALWIGFEHEGESCQSFVGKERKKKKITVGLESWLRRMNGLAFGNIPLHAPAERSSDSTARPRA